MNPLTIKAVNGEVVVSLQRIGVPQLLSLTIFKDGEQVEGDYRFGLNDLNQNRITLQDG